MYKRNNFLAIITARKNSKRLKRKNLLKINNKPLIQYTFDEAKKSKYLDEILVSTDDETIIKLAKKNNISAPFLRPKHLSKDNSTAYDVLAHSADWFKNNYSKSIDYIMLLQPTSPLRTFNDIDNCIKLIVNTGSNTLVSVGKLHSPYDWTLKLNKNSNFFSFNKKKITKRSQLLDPAYFLNGAIFISKYNYYLGNKSFFSKKTCIYKMPFKRSIDIDEKDDLNLVKFYKSKKN